MIISVNFYTHLKVTCLIYKKTFKKMMIYQNLSILRAVSGLTKNIIPHTWKLANIVPIPKPNKATDKGTSYRPISLLSVIAKTLEKSLLRLQTTQPTSGGAVTADKNCCANCVEPSRPQQWGPDLPFFGHADPLDGWRCCSQKRVMSRPIQVRQH